MDAYDELLAAVAELGYPEELGAALAAGLGGEWSMRRMAGYLRGAKPRTIEEIEGEEGQNHIEEYADARTERGKCLLHTIAEKMGFTSLGYQNLDQLLEAIGIDRSQVCTYCWTGKE